MKQAKKTAQGLLDIKAITLSVDEPYTWASGIKSPIYCDNRITMSYPNFRKEIAQGLAEIIQEHYPDVQAIVGTATAGIPQACWVADILQLPMAYARPKPKDHGKGKQIEGAILAGMAVVVIEDLISTGSSVLKVCDVLRKEGVEVLGVAAVFTYELKQAEQNFAQHDIRLHTLSNYSTLIELALEQHTIDETQLIALKRWRENPENY